MTVAPACEYTTQQLNFLQNNFRVYEPDAPTSASQNYLSLVGKKVIFLGSTPDDPVNQRAQIEFLKEHATGRHCLLVETLPAPQRVQRSEITSFATLPESLVIEGFDGRLVGAKTHYVRMMNLIAANNAAYERYSNSEKAKMESFASFLNNLVAEGLLTFRENDGSNKVSSPAILEQIEAFHEGLKNDELENALKDTATALDNFHTSRVLGSIASSFTKETNLFSSSRCLGIAINRAVNKFDKVFVITNCHLLIGNTELYQALNAVNVTHATLLPIVPVLKPVPPFRMSLQPFQMVNLTFYTNNMYPEVATYTIPDNFAHLFTQFRRNHFSTDEISTKILTLDLFKGTKFCIEEGRRVLLPITDYRTASDYVRTHYREFIGLGEKSDHTNAFYAPFDHFVFLTGVGVQSVQRAGPGSKDELVIRNNKWYLSFYIPNNTMTISLTQNISWIDSGFLLEELAKRETVYTIKKGHELNLTNIKKDDQEELDENPLYLTEIFDTQAPNGYTVSVQGEYKVTTGGDVEIKALSDLTISLSAIVESVSTTTDGPRGTKRNVSFTSSDSKKLGLTDHKNSDIPTPHVPTVEEDLVDVQTRLTALRIEE